MKKIMKKFLILGLILLPKSSLAVESISFLGINAAGNSVLMITSDQNEDSRDYEVVTINGISTSNIKHFDSLGPGKHIIEYVGLSDGDTIELRDTGSTTLDTVTVTGTSTAFSIVDNSNDYVKSIQGSLLSDAIKANSTSAASNATSVSANTTSIANNTSAIAQNKQDIGKNRVGVAEAMAIGTMQLDWSYDGFQTSFGGASFNGAEGYALMAGKKVHDSAFISFSASGAGNVAGSVSIRW